MSRQGHLDDQISQTGKRLIELYYSSHIHTILLFTWTDYKTIFLPIVSASSIIDGVVFCNKYLNI